MDVNGSGQMTPFISMANQGTNDAQMFSDQMMQDSINMGMNQMKQTQIAGQMSMILKLAEGIAKMMKALGDAVKGLLG